MASLRSALRPGPAAPQAHSRPWWRRPRPAVPLSGVPLSGVPLSGVPLSGQGSWWRHGLSFAPLSGRGLWWRHGRPAAPLPGRGSGRRQARPPAPERPPRPWWRRLRLPLLLAAGLALAALGLWGRLPDPRAFLGALTGADYWWVILAAALQGLSLGAFAWQQRELMRALGVRLRARRAAAVTLARTAISIAMPAGAAVSAAYAVREYQRGGVSKEQSAASMIVSGLASIGGLTLLYVTGGAAVLGRDPALLLSPQPLAVVGGLLVLTTAAVVAGRRVPSFAAAIRGNGRIMTWIRRTLASAQEAWQAGAGLRTRDWAVAVLLFAINWLTDLLCLAATCRAVGLPIGVVTLAGIYLGVQIVRQVPLTPGGVGVVDTALVAGLTAAGATAVAAAAAVLIYRLISCWLLLPAGGLAAVLLRRGATHTRAE